MCWRREAVADATGAMVGGVPQGAFEVRNGSILVKSCEMGPRAAKWRLRATTQTLLQKTLASTPGRIRTCNLRIRSPLLCPLSYGRGGNLSNCYITT